MRKITKNYVKIISLFLSVVMLATLSCACVNSGYESESKSKTESSDKHTHEYEEYEVHKYESNGNDITDYQIVVKEGAGKTTLYGAEILNKYIKLSTGNELQVITDDIAPTDKEIILGQTNRVESNSVDFLSLGEEGYSLKTYGDKLLIAGNDKRGLLYGVYAFLYELGYRFYTPTVENIPKAKDVFIPEEMDITYVTPFVYREIIMDDSINNADFAVKCGINSKFMRAELKNNEKYGGTTGFAGADKLMVHTASTLLPESLFTEHPEYFALYNGNRTKLQPCWTSLEGREIIYQSVLDILRSDKNSNMISISQNDNNAICQCDRCKRSYEMYGQSGTVMLVINDIAKRIKTEFPNAYVEMLIYGMCRDNPKNVLPEDNVIIRLCSQMCNIHEDADECKTLKNNQEEIERWSKIAPQLFIWNYVTSYQNHYTPVPNFTTIYNNMQFFVKNKAKAIYYEGVGRENGEFPELRTYVYAKLAFNPNMSYSEYRYHMTDFCKGYYGEDAGEKILEYIDYLYEIAYDYCEKTGGDFDVNGQADKFLPLEFDEEKNSYDLKWLEKCQSLFDEAEECAFGEQLDRIHKSRIHLTFTELYFTFANRYKYGDASEREELIERNEELYGWIKKFGTWNMYREKLLNKNITEFDLSPRYWL